MIKRVTILTKIIYFGVYNCRCKAELTFVADAADNILVDKFSDMEKFQIEQEKL